MCIHSARGPLTCGKKYYPHTMVVISAPENKTSKTHREAVVKTAAFLLPWTIVLWKLFLEKSQRAIDKYSLKEYNISTYPGN